MNTPTEHSDAIAINEAQLVLAEKRTALAILRVGIAVIALPMTIVSFLIATSKHYEAFHVLHFLVPLVALNIVLLAFGTVLVVRAILQMRRCDRLIHELKKTHSIMGPLL
jgi:uncharacterized membrane protein YidH (DUF202 family)